MTRSNPWTQCCTLALLVSAVGCSGDDDGGALSTNGGSGAGGAGHGGASDAGAASGGGATGSPSGTGGTGVVSASGGSSAGGAAIGSGGNLAGAGGIGAGGFVASGGSAGSPDGSADGSVPSACLKDIAARGVPFVDTVARGVVDAVELTGPLNGVLIANGTSTDPATDPMACEFVKTLWDFADLLKERGFNRLGTLGSYCYRCCCAWSTTNFCRGPDDPEPDCSVNGYSTHSWGRAIDVRYYYKTDGTRYDIEDPTHFVQYTGTGETCMEALALQTGISRELYELVCEASARRIFSTILTPNYNAVHRNHTHLDIGESGSASGFFIRGFGLPYVDVADYGDE